MEEKLWVRVKAEEDIEDEEEEEAGEESAEDEGEEEGEKRELSEGRAGARVGEVEGSRDRDPIFVLIQPWVSP